MPRLLLPPRRPTRGTAMRAASLLALVNAPIAAALNNGFTKPEMGFNTWESWGCDISEQKVHAAADAMVSKGLLAAGYTCK
jgi:alpha-galactosidase